MASARVEELPDDFDERIDLNKTPSTTSAATQNDIPPSLEAMLNDSIPFPLKHDPAKVTDSSTPFAAMPPAMASVKQHTADEVLEMMNRTPLFMTTLDETDGSGGENLALEALKALAYEGTRAEISGNFREQGNELARGKQWKDAREFYDKALAALKMPLKPQDAEEGEPDMEVAQVDEEDERSKEKAIEEASLVNRALCNLEMSTATPRSENRCSCFVVSRLMMCLIGNYGSCNRDCAAVLRLNARNVKAWYRSASACLALDRVDEAVDACQRGLEVDGQNAAMKLLETKISKRKAHLEGLERKRKERAELMKQEEATLKVALKSRNIPVRKTEKGVDMEDATMSLEDPLNPASTLTIPTVFLYPAHLQSDFIKAFTEAESVGQHLTYVMPLPWDEAQEYTPEGVECYIETISGGLIKAGKKLSLLRILASGKVELVDGMLRVNVLPKTKAAAWIESFKQKKASF